MAGNHLAFAGTAGSSDAPYSSRARMLKAPLRTGLPGESSRLFHHHEHEKQMTAAERAELLSGGTAFQGMVVHSESAAADRLMSQVRLCVDFKDGQRVEFSEELANLYQPAPGSPSATTPRTGARSSLTCLRCRSARSTTTSSVRRSRKVSQPPGRAPESVRHGRCRRTARTAVRRSTRRGHLKIVTRIASSATSRYQ
jgi:hypothetical protein